MYSDGTCGDVSDYCSSGYSYGILFASGFLSGCIIIGCYAILLLENRGNVFSYYLNNLSNSRRAIIYERSSSKAKLRSKQKREQAAKKRDAENESGNNANSIELSGEIGTDKEPPPPELMGDEPRKENGETGQGNKDVIILSIDDDDALKV